MRMKLLVIALVLLVAAGCRLVPGTGDTSSDAAAAQNFVPATIAGYTSTEASSVLDALSKVGVSGSVITGNLPLAGAIAKLDDLIRCYQGVGAVSARVYTETNMPTVGVPKIGVLAVINTTRLQRNVVQCVANIGDRAGAQSFGDVQPCGGSGSHTVNGENLEYVYGATAPELCSVFQAQFSTR